MSFRRRTWEIVEVAEAGDASSRWFDSLLLTLIFLNVLAVIVGSVQAVQTRWGTLLAGFETLSVAIFTVEYVARLWSCATAPRYADGWRGRLRWAVHPMSLIDLLAIAPFYLPFFGLDLRSLRVLRLVRILRIAKAVRYWSSFQLIVRVVRSKKEELALTTALMLFLLVIASTLLYYCENAAQPDMFSSIPATMWWAVATLTTVGYGDMYPITVLGRCCASLIAVLGIGMFALPTGILGAGFVEEVRKTREPANFCPHCGKELP